MPLLRLDKELSAKLSALARKKRRSKSGLVHEAIQRLLEDDEDLALAARGVSDLHPAKTLRKLRKELGLRR